MRQLNQNLASVTGLLADNPNEVADAVRDLNDVVEVQSFVADNREALGTTSDKLAGVTQALTDSLDDVKQFLHVAPNTLQNYVNIYQPAQGAASAVLAINNFANRSPSSAVRCRRRRGWAPSSRRSCACSTWRRSSRTASTTTRPRPEPLRRCYGAAQRDHLQRGLDAARLHSAATPAAGQALPAEGGHPRTPCRPTPRRWRRKRRWRPIPPTACRV